MTSGASCEVRCSTVKPIGRQSHSAWQSSQSACTGGVHSSSTFQARLKEKVFQKNPDPTNLRLGWVTPWHLPRPVHISLISFRGMCLLPPCAKAPLLPLESPVIIGGSTCLPSLRIKCLLMGLRAGLVGSWE